jgi:hypothetical protein
MALGRRRIGLLVLGVAVAAAVVATVLALRGGTTESDALPRAASSKRVVIGPTSQVDLGKAAALRVRINVPPGMHGTVRAGIAAPGQSISAISQPVAVRRAGWTRLSLPILPAGAARLNSCAVRQLSVSLRNGDGQVVARRTRNLAPVPPRCGRFFGRSAIWNQPLPAKAPVDPRSSALVGRLAQEVRSEFSRNFNPTINTTSFSAPVYTVPATQRRVPVQLVGSRLAYGGKLAAILRAGVPIPPGARPAAGSDKHMVIWQPATDTMWELWVTENQRGRWTAQWGGMMQGVSKGPGYFSDPTGIQPGATATSLPLVGGLITQADLARGSINHALAMAIPSSRYGVWAWPAQRSDGGERSPLAIPAGARFRLDPSLDIDSLHLPPFTAMLAKAAQRYGIYVRDTSPVVTLYAEDPASIGTNPWPGAITPSVGAVLRAFPWDRLQVMRMSLFTYSGKRVKN